jgi:alginate O-acetyltransferase complex protein AlgI
MIFNSAEFIIFFVLVYTAYHLLPFRGQNRLLIVAGYVFYGWWDIRFLCLLAFSTALDYSCGLMLGTGKVPLADRVKVSLFVVAAAFGFATLRWESIRLSSPTSRPDLSQGWGFPGQGWWPNINTPGVIPSSASEWWVLALTIVLVAVANLAYFFLVRLPEENRARVTLVVTIAANLIFLAVFKYFNFFIDSFEHIAHQVGLTGPLARLHIILPVGISFYTFQSMSYTIDVYRKKMEPVHRFWDYVLFVSFFPPLVAGPIERAAHLMPQLQKPRTITLDGSTRGLYLILLGLVKKVAIADGLSASIDSVFGPGGATGWADIVVGSLLFAFQIYCDFSGYTDIARGVSKLLGIDLVRNFNLPYASRNPGEFWRRWHMSLSSWLRDYLYIPLGGNRHGELRTYRNLTITMLLGGLWHGAAWNYVLWGLYQGLVLAAYRLVDTIRGRGDGAARGPVDPAESSRWGLGSVLAWAFFFVLTCYGWLLFRATSLEQIVSFTRTLVTGPFDLAIYVKVPRLPALAGLPLLLAYEWAEYAAGSNVFYRTLAPPIRGAWYAALIFVLVMGMSNEPSQFIYFQF